VLQHKIKKSHPVWQSQQSQCTIEKITSTEYYKASKHFPIREERNVDDVISMTDNEATRTTFVRTRPTLHEDEDEAEAGCYESEAMAENFGFEATLPRGPWT